MAYFRCATGGGAGATITVTYTSDFYGETITCSHGTKTYTKVATSSGTVDFTVDEEGTWTISCLGFTDTADVDLSYSADLVAVPDGKTATPTDDIEKWLACGQITGKSYTTLSQVLADAETYERLLSDSNACDYMARSTTWAVAEGQVPTMTDNTHPSGEASAENNNADAFHVFNDSSFSKSNTYDNTGSKAWFTSPKVSSGNTAVVSYHFDTPIVARFCKFRGEVYTYNGTSYTTIKDYDIVYSDDGSTWNTLTSGTNTYTGSAPVVVDMSSNNIAHSYWGMRPKTSGSTSSVTVYIAVLNLQFYEDADITTSQDAMMRLGKYDYACDALLADSTWASAIVSSSYADYVIEPLVPTMTSNTTPSGECFADSTYSDRQPYYAFDNNSSTYWTSLNGRTPGRVGYKFATPTRVSAVKITPRGGSYYGLKNYRVEYSTDGGTTWNQLISHTYTANEGIVSTDNGSIKATDWSIYCVDTYGPTGNELDVTEIQFYGRHTAQTDIIVTAHGGDTVYYMENGSPVPLTTADSDTGIGTVDWSDLPKGAITLYSSTAKNPSDLTADYSKTVYITEYTTQIYLMPDNALYWWGYLASDVTVASAGVTDVTASGYTHQAPTFSTYYVTLNASGGSDDCYMFKKDIGDATFVNVIASGSGYAFIKAMDALPYDFATTAGHVIDTALGSTKQKYSLTITSGYNKATAVRANSGGQITMDAWWIE